MTITSADVPVLIEKFAPYEGTGEAYDFVLAKLRQAQKELSRDFGAVSTLAWLNKELAYIELDLLK